MLDFEKLKEKEFFFVLSIKTFKKMKIQDFKYFLVKVLLHTSQYFLEIITVATQDSKVHLLHYYKYKRDISPGSHEKCFSDLKMKMVLLVEYLKKVIKQPYELESIILQLTSHAVKSKSQAKW